MSGDILTPTINDIIKNERETMTQPTKEYLLAKARLCGDVAMKQAEEGDLGAALGNLLRMQNAMEILKIEEDGKWKRK